MATEADSKQTISDLSDLIKLDYDAMKILTKGTVVIAGLVGDDTILKAMRANEEVTNTKYEHAVETSYAEPIEAI